MLPHTELEIVEGAETYFRVSGGSIFGFLGRNLFLGHYIRIDLLDIRINRI